MSVVFFTDRDLGKRFPRLLRENGVVVKAHHEHFKPQALDEDWLPVVVAQRDWYVLTHDHRIFRNSFQRQIVIHAGLGLFVVIGHVSTKVLALNTVNTMPRIQEFIDKHSCPFIAGIYRPNPVSDVFVGRPGRVELKWPDSKEILSG